MSLSIAQIAAQLAGYDPQSLSVHDAQQFLANLVQPIQAEEQIPLAKALGRVLARTIISPINVPPHDNSAMDGYAFHGDVLNTNAHTELRLVGTLLAGQVWQGTVAQHECVKIMTGAVMPAGLDTVVPQELVHSGAINPALGETIAIAPGLLKKGDNRRFAGEDLKQNEAALHQGERLNSAALGLLASLGLAHISVFRPLRVAYFSTGNEILSLGEAPRQGAVYDSNRFTLLGLLSHLGVEIIDLGVVPDHAEALQTTLEKAAQAGADAIISSGGVSVGEADYTRHVMAELGDVAFWRLAMRPGRPMTVGRLNKIKLVTPATTAPVLFGLPGNPVAVMVTFLIFVRPALLQMMGCNGRSTQAPPLLKARSQQLIRKKAGRTEYHRALVTSDIDGSLQVKTIGNQGSGVLSSMVQANGLMVLSHAQNEVAVGDSVDVMLLSGLI